MVLSGGLSLVRRFATVQVVVTIIFKVGHSNFRQGDLFVGEKTSFEVAKELGGKVQGIAVCKTVLSIEQIQM